MPVRSSANKDWWTWRGVKPAITCAGSPVTRPGQTCSYPAVQVNWGERRGFVLLRLINMSLCHWMDRTEEMDLSPGSRSVMIESVGIFNQQ